MDGLDRARTPLPRAKGRSFKCAGIFLRTCARQRTRNIILGGKNSRGRHFGESLLPALQPGARSRPKICGYLHVCPNCRNSATPEVDLAAHLLLPAVLGFARHGTATGRRPQYRRLADDPRSGGIGPRAESSCMGKLARSCGSPALDRNRGQRSHLTRRVFRVLSGCGRSRSNRQARTSTA